MVIKEGEEGLNGIFTYQKAFILLYLLTESAIRCKRRKGED
jgi:hypothetical protein